MRIALICSSLQPGRDGVGDYVRRLTNELRSMGHTSIAIALNDPGDCLDEPNIIRLPRKTAWSKRWAQTRECLAKFSPDLVSLQWVPYGWHPRGYPRGVASPLSNIVPPNAKRHLMVHECWVGINIRDTILHRVIIGPLQRAASLKVFRNWQAQVTHTSIPAFAACLQRYSIKATVLPLFGNIPVVNEGQITTLDQLLPHDANAAPQLIVAWFGTVPIEWNAGELLIRLSAAAKSHGRRLVILSLGRTGAHGHKLTEWLNTKPDLGLHLPIGECSEAKLSSLLKSIDIGLSGVPLALVGKSGAIAAFHEHGIPVLCTRNDWMLSRSDQNYPDLPLVYYSPSGSTLNLDDYLNSRRPADNSAVSHIAQKLLDSLPPSA